MISPRGGESVQVHALAPQQHGMLPKRSSSFLPHSEYWGYLHNWGAGRGWGHSSQRSELIKDTRILLTTSGFHQEACPWAAGHASPVDPLTGAGYSQCSECLTPAHTCTPWSWPRGQWVWAFWWACTERWLNSEGLGKSAQTWAFRPPYGKQNERLSVPTWLCRTKRGHTILKIPCSPTIQRGNKKCGTEVSTEKVSQSLRIWQSWQVKVFLSWSQGVKETGGSNCLFKCEDSDARL